MSELKKHNSIIFLTTLSVYLGLVLVGGAGSSVLAQAALTRNFDIQEEIEYKDDLDKKPDDLNKESEKFQDIIDRGFITQSVIAVLEDLKKLRQIEKYNGEQRFEIEYLFRRYENLSKFKLDKLEASGNSWIFTACEEPALLVEHHFNELVFDEALPSNFYIYDGSLNAKVTNTNVKVLSESGEFVLQITSKRKSNNDAQELAYFLNEVFKYGSLSKNLSDYERVIYENTKAKTEDDQLFLITNLPRASIDSLFAKKDANQAASEK